MIKSVLYITYAFSQPVHHGGGEHHRKLAHFQTRTCLWHLPHDIVRDTFEYFEINKQITTDKGDLVLPESSDHEQGGNYS